MFPLNSWLKQTFIHYQYWQSYLRQSKKLADLLKLTKKLLGGSVCDIISCNFFSGAVAASGEANLLSKGMSKQCMDLVCTLDNIFLCPISLYRYEHIRCVKLLDPCLSKLFSYNKTSFHYKKTKYESL